MPRTIGLDIGKGAIKIAVIKNDKVVKTHIIEVVENDSKHILQQLKRFININKLKAAKINVLIKDYRTRRIKIDRLRGKDLRNALLFEREEKIGTSEILGENYKDNHVIQKKTNNSLDVLLTVINDDELDTLNTFFRELGIEDVNYYMECFTYNDIAPDNSVIVDVGYSSIELMFFDRKRVLKTSFMKKGIVDIIEELKDKVDDNIKFKDFMNFTLADQEDPKYDIIISKLGLYAENIINGINTFARENSKNAKSIKVCYTGGIFCISGMAEYFNYLMGVEGKIIKVYGGKEEPLFNNSIALAYKDGTKGRISIGSTDLVNKIGKIASYGVFILATFMVVAGAYRTYEYFSISAQKENVERIYTEKKKVYDSISSDYSQLAGLWDEESQNGAENAKNISDLLGYIQTSMSKEMTIKKMEMNAEKLFIIDGTSDNYTNFGIFCTQLKKIFSRCDIKTLTKTADTTVVFRLECKF
ncbi:MAG: hypothetical protein ACM3KR_01850 [Deltaproteobacteria bacterium]